MTTKRQNTISFNSFFAGIGGFDLAFEKAGFSPRFQCEINSFCRNILEHHWPQVQHHDDITTLKAADIPQATIWCGGFPCQDVSVARGSKGRKGLQGKNSGLFYPYADLIEAKRPEIVLIENVTGLLNSHNGQDFRVIIERLSDIGYTVAWRVMNSRFFGAPQSRPRVFICATLNNPALAVKALFEEKPGSKPKNQRKGFLDVSECEISGAKVAQVSYCLAATSGRHTGTDWSRTYVSYDTDVRRLTPTECEGVQGFPINWTKPTSAFETNDLDTPRYHALGNAVAIPVVYWIARQIKENINSEDSFESASSFVEFIKYKFGDFSKSSRTQDLSELHLDPSATLDKLQWRSGGVAYKGTCIDIKAPQAPSNPIEKKLIDVIESQTVHSKYFLSPNAAQGILRRVDSQNRKLFDPMHKALIKLSERLETA